MTPATRIKLTVLHNTIYLEFAIDASEYILVCCRPWHTLGVIRTVLTAWDPGEILFFQVSNVRFHRFPVGQISQNLNETRRQSVRPWILSEQNFENFPVRGRFSKTRKNSNFFNLLRLQTAITPQWLQIDGNSLYKITLYWMSSFHFYRATQLC